MGIRSFIVLKVNFARSSAFSPMGIFWNWFQDYFEKFVSVYAAFPAVCLVEQLHMHVIVSARLFALIGFANTPCQYAYISLNRGTSPFSLLHAVTIHALDICEDISTRRILE